MKASQLVEMSTIIHNGQFQDDPRSDSLTAQMGDKKPLLSQSSITSQANK